MSGPPIVLYINFYTDKSKDRQNELDYCIKTNGELSCIDKIYMVVDDVETYQQWSVDYPKIHLHLMNKRPTYMDFFIFINQTQEHPQQINMLSNTDIYFNTSLQQLKSFRWNNVALCLSHQEALLADSQDTWAWQGPMRNITPESSFCLGFPGCENRLANILHKSGYKPHNPSKSIIAMHMHKSMIRHYTHDMRIYGEYTTIQPSHLGDFSKGSSTFNKSRPPSSKRSRHHSAVPVRSSRSKTPIPLLKRSHSVAVVPMPTRPNTHNIQFNRKPVKSVKSVNSAQLLSRRHVRQRATVRAHPKVKRNLKLRRTNRRRVRTLPLRRRV